MAGKTLDIRDIIVPDQLANEIANQWLTWETFRNSWKKQKVEIREYVFAVDTTHTSNESLPWNNKTHIPKLCQIRDNLIANYMATVFPKRKNVIWEGAGEDDETPEKSEAIRDYMGWAISQKEFKDEILKCISDYVDDGNTLVTTQWIDETTEDENGLEKPGFVGPRPKRLNPFDVVLNPIAPSAKQSPKIVRSLWTMGEAKAVIDQMTKTVEEKEIAEGVWEYMLGVRDQASNYGGDFKEVDEYLQMDGFDSYRHYLGSNYVELLSFYGDFFDTEKKELLRNAFIVVVDRTKIIIKRQHPSRSGALPIHHAGWRIRQDNIWAMGPLDNLVGMQYRIDHVENMKADILDLTTYPPIKEKGIVEDYEWGPFERIRVDQDGDVELMSPKIDTQQVNIEIQLYETRMEEMAGSPKEAMGFRTPGEKTKYEVQRLENAASRIFQSKINQFEEQIIEPILNDMLALARDNLTETTIRVIDDEFKSVAFRNLTKEDLSAQGKLKPVAARHFAEKAEMVQNLNTFFSSPAYADPAVAMHFSGIRIAEAHEQLLEIEDFDIVAPYIRLSEQADAQRRANVNEEQVAVESQIPSGVTPDDFDDELDEPEGVEDGI